MGLQVSGNKIGLFGGSFDPPHVGHVALVQAGLDMGLDQVWVIPALPVHRELSGKADAVTRLAWLQRFFAQQAKVKVLDWEITQGEPTPAIASLRRFKATYPATVPWLMLGADAWQGLPSWREYPAHQKLCNMAVFARQGGESITHMGWKKAAIDTWSTCITAGHCYDVQVELPDISATVIRQRAASGLSLTGLVPKVLQSDIEQRYA